MSLSPRPLLNLLRRFDRAALGAGLCGAGYGLGLARCLFESHPQHFIFLSAWPGVLLVAGACAGAVAALSWALRAPPQASFAPLALLLPLVSVLSPEVNLLRAQVLLLGALVLFLLLAFTAEGAGSVRPQSEAGRDPVTRSPRHPLLLSLVLFVALFLLYLRTLGPTVGEADSFEFQVGVARLGVAHGNGYPLLMLLGRWFTLLPVGGSLAFRANLTSAFFGALAAVGVERLARRLGAGPLSALLAGLAFGVSPTLWARATEIEAYTLNAAFTALILYTCLRLVADSSITSSPSTPYSAREAVIRHSSLLAFVFGLGLTNHLTLLVLAPAGLAAALLAYRRWLTADSPTLHAPRFTVPFAIRHLSFVIFFFLLGLSVYLYLPLRWPAVNHGEVLSWDQFLYLLRGGEARGYLNPFLPFEDPTRYAPTLRKILGEYTPVGAALALAGMVGLIFRRGDAPAGGRPGALILALAYAGYAYFVVAYDTREPDWSDFFIPLHLIAAVLLGVGLQALLNVLHHQTTSSRPGIGIWSFARCSLLTACCLLPLRSIWLTLPRVDRSADWASYRLGQYILRQPLAHGATILADPARLAPLYYLQVVEGLRPDLDVVILPDEASYRAMLDERLAAGQTVYLARYLPGLGSAYSLRSVGPLTEVSPQPFMGEAQIPHPLSATLASGIRLLGYASESLSAAAPEALRLTLFWRADAPADDHHLVYLRLKDGEGRVAWQSAGSVPAGGLYPTNAWRPGEVIADFHSVPIGFGLAPGGYRLEAGLFPPFRAEEDSGWAEVAPVTVLAPAEAPSPPRLLRARFGAQWLMGYALPESSPPGARVNVTLYWLRAEESENVSAFGETRALGAWPVGSLVPLEYRLTAPTTGDHFQPSVENGQPAHCGWLAPATASCLLPPIQLIGEAAAEGAAIYDNQILLRRAALGTPTVERGGLVEVNLQWQALTTIGEDYTVFVHLVGPDGALHGQVDYWPQGGTLGTSQWRPGQVIDDPYRVPVAGDAPPGEYSVHIGFYLLATLERLPVLNADGQPVDDKLVLIGLIVK